MDSEVKRTAIASEQMAAEADRINAEVTRLAAEMKRDLEASDYRKSEQNRLASEMQRVKLFEEIVAKLAKDYEEASQKLSGDKEKMLAEKKLEIEECEREIKEGIMAHSNGARPRWWSVHKDKK